MILKSIVSWVLARHASKDSHSGWSSFEVTTSVAIPVGMRLGCFDLVVGCLNLSGF